MDRRTEAGGGSSPEERRLVYTKIVETRTPAGLEIAKVTKPYFPFEVRQDHRYFGINE